jgi:SAM-dependent methyltransferase
MTDTVRAGDDFLPLVKQQYEALPYPPRDPDRERERLIHGVGDNLITLSHHCFGGRKDYRGGFRALVAGGGTGDSTIYLGEQLREFDAEVVHLDLSAASMAVAQQRAAVRQLANIRWVNASIMNLPALGLGQFDYINCTGVLHHLESAEAGLAVLRRMLRPDGVILLMLYGKYGRRPVYDMQELLRQYLPPGAGIADKIRMTRQLLVVLPETNSFRRDLDLWQNEISRGGFGDAGLYDLLLHSQDRCFDVNELYELADSAGLDVLAFADRAVAYEPHTHLKQEVSATHLDRVDLRRRQAIAELMTCDLIAHEFYLGRHAVHRPASLDNEGNALSLAGAMHGHHLEISAGLTPGRTLNITGRSGTLALVGNALNRALFAQMDAVTPLAQVYERVRAQVPGLSRADIRAAVRELYGTLHSHGHLYLLEAGSYGVKVPDYTRLPPPAPPGAL